MFSLLPFKKIDADAGKDYALSEQQGPWMIMAYSFSSPDAEAQARKLALELRRDFQMSSFVHRQEYDYSQPVQGLGVDKFGKPKKMKYVNGAVAEEWAVLVGNFKTFDDPDAVRVLERVRLSQPKTMGAAGADANTKTISVNMIRDYYKNITRDPEKKQRGPLGKAFMTRNPKLPPEEVAKGTLDPFVKDLNQGIEHTILQNKGRYTVQIATFRGVAAFNEREFNESASKNSKLPKIDEAAIKATKVVNTLRKQGVEAYVFHDRYESLVTIGSFDDLGTPGKNGRTELHAEIASIVQKYQAERNAIPGSDQFGLVPKTIDNIPLDVSPRIIQVPRENLADIYGRQAAR
jgi:hypothetical protein